MRGKRKNVIAQYELLDKIRRKKLEQIFGDWLVLHGDTSSENWRYDNYEYSFAVMKPGRWARKSLSAKECVTTHLSNGRILCHVL